MSVVLRLYVLSKVQLRRLLKIISCELTDTAICDNSVPIITLLPIGDLHYPVTAVTLIVGCIFHGLEGRHLEWKSLLQDFSNLNKKENLNNKRLDRDLSAAIPGLAASHRCL